MVSNEQQLATILSKFIGVCMCDVYAFLHIIGNLDKKKTRNRCKLSVKNSNENESSFPLHVCDTSLCEDVVTMPNSNDCCLF